MSATAEHPSNTPHELFGRILCVTDRSTPGAEAARQAAVLAGPGGAIDLVNVAPERPPDHDLVVIAAGDTGFQLLDRAPGSLLLTRTPVGGSPFPESILVAVDGSDEAHAAARLGAKLAALRDATVALVAAPEHDAVHQNALERDIQAMERITGTRPVVLDEYRAPVPSILSAATSVEASVIVLGRRPGSPSPSISAEVATAAPCSVLVVRPG